MQKERRGDMPKVTLAGARVSKGWTQQDIADKLGVSRVIVNRWETGKSEIKTAYLIAFCSLTGFSIDDISLPENLQNVDKEAEE